MTVDELIEKYPDNVMVRMKCYSGISGVVGSNRDKLYSFDIGSLKFRKGLLERLKKSVALNAEYRLILNDMEADDCEVLG